MSRRAKVVVTVAAVCLPAATYCVFSPRSALTAVPLLLGATAAGARILFVVLPLCRCSARASHAVVLLSCLGLSIYIALSRPSAETAPCRFAPLFTGPVPQGVRFIAAHGQALTTGAYQIVVFSMEPGDFGKILRDCEYEGRQWGGRLPAILLLTLQQHGIDPVHVYRKPAEIGYRLLITNREESRLCMYRFRP